MKLLSYGLCWLGLILAIPHAAISDDAKPSTPKATLLRALDAWRAEDRDALERCIFADKNDENAVAWLRLAVDITVVRQRLDRLSTQKFGRVLIGSDKVVPHVFLSDSTFKHATESIEAAKITPDEKDATKASVILDLTIFDLIPTTKPAETQGTQIDLKQVDGEWKIDVTSSYKPTRAQGALPGDVEAINKEQRFFRDCINNTVVGWKEIADGIEGGKYKSYDEANAALRLK